MAIQKHRCRAHSMQNKINSSCVDLEMCLYSLIFVWRSMDVTCMLCPQLPVVIEILRFLFWSWHTFIEILTFFEILISIYGNIYIFQILTHDYRNIHKSSNSSQNQPKPSHTDPTPQGGAGDHHHGQGGGGGLAAPGTYIRHRACSVWRVLSYSSCNHLELNVTI